MPYGQIPQWSDRNSAQAFDSRYSDEGLRFWVPRLIEVGTITEGQTILDAGSGTGGFGAGVSAASGARVIGCDIAERFIRYARDNHAPIGWWMVGDAARLPLRDQTVDRVLMSLLLHRVPEPATVIAEAARVLRSSGALLIHTIAPEDAAVTAPYRYFPHMAAAQRRRMPAVARLDGWCRQAGLTDTAISQVTRPMAIDADALEKRIYEERPHRYPDISATELTEGMQQLRIDQDRHGGPWYESRVHTLMTAERPE
ncbi:MAG: methyltransferase domain-containing protein [Mycobacterium sp.]|nr:methyltransferase domain-containing protein [Mycobacterium sp.]